MAAQTERVMPDAGESMIRPVELLTENGYGILRRWEIESAPAPMEGPYDFVVRDANGNEHGILVTIAPELFLEIEVRTRGRVLAANSFWICSAERHLADYIGEQNACPSDSRLLIARLTPEDLDQADRWGTR